MNIKLILSFISLSILLVFFNNCGGGFTTASDQANSLSGSEQNGEDGATEELPFPPGAEAPPNYDPGPAPPGVDIIAQKGSFYIAVDAKQNTPVGTPLTFGLPFGKIDLAYGESLTGSVNIGGVEMPIEVQLDKQASHCLTRDGAENLTMEFMPKNNCAASDRYIKHGIVSTFFPMALASGQRAQFTLTKKANTDPMGGEISFPNDLTLQTNILLDGVSYRADLSAIPQAQLNMADPPMAGTTTSVVSKWIDGKVAREWIVRVPFVNLQNANDTHAHLIARYNIRKYSGSGNTKIDVIVENNWTFVPDMKSYNYQVEVLVNGAKRYEDLNLNHFTHARWKVSIWDKFYPELHIIHDPMQLISSKVSPNYNQDLLYNLDDSLRADYDEELTNSLPSGQNGLLQYNRKINRCFQDEFSSSTRNCDQAGVFKVLMNRVGPMSHGALPVFNMGITGGRRDIGPLPGWTAAYILEQRYSLYKMMMYVADGSGSWPIHYRDKATDLPASIADHPNLFHGGTNNDPENLITCRRNANCVSPYKPHDGHEPQLAFIPYVITGDYYYLEELQFWNTHNVISKVPAYRGREKGLVEGNSQVRAMAWSVRTMGQTAYITPDDNGLKNYALNLVKTNNEQFLHSYVDTPTETNTFGAVNSNGRGTGSAAWSDDYVTWAFGHLLELGFESARTFSLWKNRFPTQRMGFQNSPYCWVFGAQYAMLIGPAESRPLSMDPNIPTVQVTSGKGLGESSTKTIFRDISSVWTYTNGGTNGVGPLTSGGVNTVEECGSAAQFAEQNLPAGGMEESNSTGGMASQMGPALAMAADSNDPEGLKAWNRYFNRTNAPSYRSNPIWAIVPRSTTPSFEFKGFPTE